MFKAVLDAVNTINNDAYDITSELGEDEGFPVLELHTDGSAVVVSLSEAFVIWSSEDDVREYYKDKDDWEPMEPYLRKKTQELLDKLGSIKLLTKEVVDAAKD